MKKKGQQSVDAVAEAAGIMASAAKAREDMFNAALAEVKRKESVLFPDKLSPQDLRTVIDIARACVEPGDSIGAFAHALLIGQFLAQKGFLITFRTEQSK
uniref:Uncharacterized protein n=1 Tax=viral metagenome TaxID=1070528 RepID=A0A6M3IE42_9ZZZZ